MQLNGTSLFLNAFIIAGILIIAVAEMIINFHLQQFNQIPLLFMMK